MSHPRRRLRRRTWHARRRVHRMIRPLRRPARVLVVLAILVVVVVGVIAGLQTPPASAVRGEVGPGPGGTTVLARSERGDLAIAGLRVGDRILAFDGDTLTAGVADGEVLTAYETYGDTVVVVVERGGTREAVDVVAGRQEALDALQFGLSASAVRSLLGALNVFGLLAFAVAGLVLFVRARARGYFASLATALLAVAGGFAFVALTNWEGEGEGVARPLAVVLILVAVAVFVSALPAIASALVRFPDGRFEPRWTRWVGKVSGGGVFAAFALVGTSGALGFDIPDHVFTAALIGLVALPAVGLAQKYRRADDAVVRQKMKWVLLPFGTLVALLVLSVAGEVVSAFDSAVSATGYLFDLVVEVLLSLALAAVPLGALAGAFGFRPWDADLWIARSVAVGAATLGLAAAFAGAAEALRVVLRSSMGEGAEAVAAALAAVVALAVFNPVREWLTRRADADLRRTRERLTERLPLLLAGRQVVGSPAEIGRVAIAAVREVLETDRAAVLDLNPGGWEVVAAEGVEPEAALAWAEGALDPAATPPGSVQVWEDPVFVLRVPLRSAEDELVGVLALGTHGRGRGYSTEERRTLDGVARALAEALRVAERREAARAREAARLEALVERLAGLGDGAARPAVPDA